MSGETLYPAGARVNRFCTKCRTLYKDGERHACATPAYDNRKCPPYLTAGGMEYMDIIEAFVPDKPYRWHALKYLLRCGKKPGQDEVTELRKALFWIEREIAHIEAGREPDLNSLANVVKHGVRPELDGRNGLGDFGKDDRAPHLSPGVGKSKRYSHDWL